MSIQFGWATIRNMGKYVDRKLLVCGLTIISSNRGSFPFIIKRSFYDFW